MIKIIFYNKLIPTICKEFRSIKLTIYNNSKMVKKFA